MQGVLSSANDIDISPYEHFSSTDNMAYLGLSMDQDEHFVSTLFGESLEHYSLLA